MLQNELDNIKDAYESNIGSKTNVPSWCNVQEKTQGSRNITIDTWNSIIVVLKKLASDANSDVTVVKEILNILKTIDADKASIEYVDSEINTRVEQYSRQDGDTAEYVYVSSKDEPSKVYRISSLTPANSVPIRDADGCVTTRDPTIAFHAVNLKYLNNNYGSTFNNVTYDSENHILEFKAVNDTSVKIDLPIETLVRKGEFIEDTQTVRLYFEAGGAEDVYIDIPISKVLPVWISSLESLSEKDKSIPPTSGAVQEYVGYVRENFADAIIGTVRDSDVVISDFSSSNRWIECSLLSKNLFDVRENIGKTVDRYGAQITIGEDGGFVCTGTPTGATSLSVNITLPRGIYIFRRFGDAQNVKCNAVVNGESTSVLIKDGSILDLSNKLDLNNVQIAVSRNTNGTAMSGTLYIQIEEGRVSNSTEYTMYADPAFGKLAVDVNGVTTEYTADANGNIGRVPCKSNQVRLITSDVLVVKAVYNRDTNAVINELMQAIISLGGNV